MKVYPYPGDEIDLTRNGSGCEAACVETLDLGEGIVLDVPVRVTATEQRTNGGVSRTMIKVNASIPRGLGIGTIGGSLMNVNTAKGYEDASFHAVQTLGPNMLALTQNALYKTPTETLIKRMIGMLVALLAAKSSPDMTVEGAGAPMINGTKGLWPLDVEDGVYGDTVAPA